jgi:acetyltransferase
MSIHNMEKLFEPDSIAVIGASERRGSVGAAIMRNLIQGRYIGKIFPVNPNHRKLWDFKTVPSLGKIDSPVDLAIIAVPIQGVPEIIREGVKSGVGGVVIISAGGKEIGIAGKELEESIKKEAIDSGLRIIGPNCAGIISSKAKLNASFLSHLPLPGKMAFVSQSGAICSVILDLSLKEQMGFNYFISLGSMLDVDFGDTIDYLGGDPKVSSIILYVESLTRFRNFMSAARAVSRVKPIVVFKAGRSSAGARAAASHTGAMAGEDSIYDTAFKRAGIVRAKTFEELFDCAELLAKQPKPAGAGLGIITNAGGPGVMATDALSDYGVEPAGLGSDTLNKLNEILPPHWSKANPIDMLGEASPALYRRVVEICIKSPELDGLLIMLAPQGLTDPTDVAIVLKDVLRKTSLPVVTSWVGGLEVERGRDVFNQAGIPTFDSPERAVRAFMDIYRYSRNIEMLQEIPPKLPEKLEFDQRAAKDLIEQGLTRKNTLLTEIESKSLLSAYGIPTNPTEMAKSEAEAIQISEKIGFPVAMKILSREITHKTEADGVRLDLKNKAEMIDAFEQITASARQYNPDTKIDGVSIQLMTAHSDYELIVGVKKDRDFGPVILFGMGGAVAEVVKDRSLALPPLNRLLARKLIEETNVYQLLKGCRNHPPANLEILEEILIRLSQLVTDFTEIEELDVNPLAVTQNSFCAVDARVLLKPSEVKAPLHLVISSYPNQYEAHVTTKAKDRIFIRPIRPEDAPLLAGLFDTLSPRSVYHRFFTPLKKFPHSMLARFTQIDYDREIAVVAMPESESAEKILGVARFILERNLKNAEFSMVVGDPWQRRGIGAELIKLCLSIARERRIKKIWGVVLAENLQMLNLGRKLGFKIKKASGVNEYDLEIEFQENRAALNNLGLQDKEVHHQQGAL